MSGALGAARFIEQHSPSTPPFLGVQDAHVWRIDLTATHLARTLRPVLSAAECARADRFHRAEHADRFVVAHGVLRCILAGYLHESPAELQFQNGEHGKPSLANAVASVEFNLSHSGDIALLAVARGRAVGVDVEQWDDTVEHLAIAERFFSPIERTVLRSLALERGAHVAGGFFAAWSRKEAYLKATGVGIARGLHHFDVSLHPDAPAELLADRLDVDAVTHWSMHALDVGARYSGALVVRAPVGSLQLLDASRWQRTSTRPP